MIAIETKLLKLSVVGSADEMFSLSLADGGGLAVASPSFEIDGKATVAALSSVSPASTSGAPLPEGVRELAFSGTLRDCPDIALTLFLRVADDSSVVRFRYELAPAAGASAPHRLTKSLDRDALDYATVDFSAFGDCTEVRFSEFDCRTHAFHLVENPVPCRDFEDGLDVFGPLFASCGGGHAAYLAYEHGSQTPDAFVSFRLADKRRVTVHAVKGNYCRGRAISADDPFETIWFEAALVAGGMDELASACRYFLLRRCSPNAASRKPWIFYNSWGAQERDKWWNHHAYLDSMNEKRMLEDIDIAHRMGIDVFVLDTGWYEKTGDWRASSKRFPRGLGPIRERLESYGMKLGLWFSPTEAAVTSNILARNRSSLLTFNGEESSPHPVWETEDSQNLCLVSRYWEDFADELVRLSRELGVTYFKWDAISQYGCDSDKHWHGGPDAPAQERADCYAFEQVRYMAKVVDKICAACPEAIVDFDVTEGGRSVGLAFLAAGKYFAVNNGAYFPNYDVPYDWRTATYWSNIFVYPGPARGWFSRSTLDFDRWIPSVLFLTHYLPDAPRSSELINIASLVLGQNGIWGDLQVVPEEGVKLFGEVLGVYKQVRDSITAADPVCRGCVGGSPEIHEKIAADGRGVVCVFASESGSHTYVTRNKAGKVLWQSEGVEVSYDAAGRAIVKVTFDGPGARMAFFG